MLRVMNWLVLAMLALTLACTSAGAQNAGLQAAAAGAPVLAPKGLVARIQHDQSCLSIVDTPYCADYGGDLYTLTFRTDLGCCHEGSHGQFVIPGLTGMNIGQCMWSVVEGDHDATSTAMYGTFDVTCYLSSGAKECLQSSCDNMVLTAQGAMFHINDIVTDDPSLTSISTCYYSLKRSSDSQAGNSTTKWRHQHHSKTGDSQKERQPGAAGTAAHTTADGSPQLYYVSYAHVLSGPMTVYDRLSGQQWDGWLETVYYWSVDDGPVTPITEAEAAQYTFLRPNRIMLNQFKPQQY